MNSKKNSCRGNYMRKYGMYFFNQPSLDWGISGYSKALRCMFFGKLKSSKLCIIRSVVCNTVFKNKKKSVLLKVSTLQQVSVYLKYKKHAKTCNACISSTYLFIKKRASSRSMQLEAVQLRPYCTKKVARNFLNCPF